MLLREDFIDRLAKKGYTKRDSDAIITDFLQTLEEIMVEGESVMFRGFGTFEVKERVQREIVSPTTKERMVVPPYRSPHFSAGKLLKRKVKEGAHQE